MQKTTRLQRLLAVVVAVFMAVCCLPLNAFAAGQAKVTFQCVDANGNKVGSEQVLTLDTHSVTDEGEFVTFTYGEIKDQITIEDGYHFDESQSATQVEKKCGLASDMTSYYVGEVIDFPVVANAKTADFTVNYVYDGTTLKTKSVHFEYTDFDDPTDAWTYFSNTDEFKTLSSEYKMVDFVVPQPAGSVTYTGAGQYSITSALDKMTITVNLEKISTAQTVEFSVRFVSDDGVIDNETKDASVPYDENGTIFDAWTFIQGTGSYENYVALGYEMKNFVVPQPAGDVTYTGAGQFSITPDLNDKVITVNLSKAEEPSTVEYVDFVIHFVSADGEIDVTKNASVSYDEYGTIFDAWTFFQGTGSYKNYAKEGYQMVNFVVPHAAGDATYTGAGQFSITPALAGMTVTVNLEKPVVSKDESTYTFNFYETNNKNNVLHEAVTVKITDFDNLVDKYVMDLFATAREEIEESGNWTYNFYESDYNQGVEGQVDALVVPGVNMVYNVYFNCNDRSSKYTIHFVDENNNEFMDPAVVNMAWVEGQELNLMAQLKDTLATVNAKGYTFKTLTAWNGTEAYKGDELVVPGEYELIAHCVKNTSDSTGGDNNSNNNNSNSNNNNTKTVSSNNNQVVKADAPADNTAKIMPQTGLSVETPVVFGVMMVAALAGAGAYLFAIRKKLN